MGKLLCNAFGNSLRPSKEKRDCTSIVASPSPLVLLAPLPAREGKLFVRRPSSSARPGRPSYGGSSVDGRLGRPHVGWPPRPSQEKRDYTSIMASPSPLVSLATLKGGKALCKTSQQFGSARAAKLRLVQFVFNPAGRLEFPLSSGDRQGGEGGIMSGYGWTTDNAGNAGDDADDRLTW